jgi:phospho-N-acetylmuramoyl-pentapeptide-transferase
MWFEFLSKNSVSFSASLAFAFLMVLIFGRIFIPRLKNWQRLGQPIRTDGVARHIKEKEGTPTMGGLFFIPAILISSMIFMDWSNLVSWIPLIAMVAFGIIGFIDDCGKLIRGNAYAGLSEKGRLLIEGAVAVGLAFMIDSTMPVYLPSLSVIIPFGIVIPLGIFYFVWSYFVIVGTANATNITDGLDGMLSKIYLCSLVVMIVALIGITRIGFMPNLVFLPEAAALFPIFGATFGAVLGFLWFNAKPASVFMGDVGSLALGGLLGSSALLMKSEIIMAVSSMMMVLILVSSFIQMMYYKFSKTRRHPPFLMAPLHHHFEMKGWGETKIAERFFIMSVIFAGIAVALLKL